MQCVSLETRESRLTEYLVTDVLEQCKNFERIEILVDSSIQVRFDLPLSFCGRQQRFLPLPHLICRFLGAELVMDDLERASLLHCAIRGCAVWTVDRLPGKNIHSFDESLSLYILKIWSPESFQVSSSVRLFQEHSRAALYIKIIRNRTSKTCINTNLAYALQDSNSMLEVPYMKKRESELDIRIMPDTVHRRETTRLAKRVLLSSSL